MEKHMKSSLHTLAWDNVNLAVVESHKNVTKHFNLDVNYYHQNTPHGLWIHQVLHKSTEDVVGFLDIDCVPVNNNIIKQVQEYVYDNQTFMGTAQISGHQDFVNRCHVFAAPCFFFIYREKWFELGCPAFGEANNCDVAQFVSKKAESVGFSYRCLYPTHYDKKATEPTWKLNNYGNYGIGTHYRGGVYHLYESRNNTNIDLFVKRCNEIINGSFSTQDMYPTFDDNI